MNMMNNVNRGCVNDELFNWLINIISESEVIVRKKKWSDYDSILIDEC